MGFTPSQVDAMSLWEFTACLDGFNASRGAKREPEFSDDLLAELGLSDEAA